MKNYYTVLLFLFFGSSLLLDAQINQALFHKDEPQQILPGTDAKATFIKNGNYLAESSLKNYNRYYGDSLLGFDEVAIKAELLSHNVFGKEYLGYITLKKRQYIDQKYGIGSVALPKNPNAAIGAKRIVGVGGNTIANIPCVNEDFETTPTGSYTAGNSVSGWAISSRTIGVCHASNSFTAGSPEFSVMATPIANALPSGTVFQGATLGNSPLGGTNVIRMNDLQPDYLQTKISQTFPVTTSNSLFQFAYAGLWNDGGHLCCEQPSFQLLMYNCVGDTLACISLSLNAYGSGCPTGLNTYSFINVAYSGSWAWTSWQVRGIDLTPFIGSCVTIEVINNDCIYGGHAGSVYFDALCGSALTSLGFQNNGNNVGVPVGFCANSTQAQITAPSGYTNYQWYAGNPPTPVTAFGLGGNTQVLTINNPVVNDTYTVQLVTASGCTFTTVDTLKYSSVSIVGLRTAPTCSNGSSGSATVQGNGSGTGYTYVWSGPNTSTAVVGTASVATGLSAGIYSVTVAGTGTLSCGSALATVTIGIGPPQITSVAKAYCGSEAYLTVTGTNVQWYNDTTLIPANQGGTASSYTVNSPANGQIYWVTFNAQGCKDSLDFQLIQTSPGSLTVTNVAYSCQGQANATANIVLTPGNNVPSGQNSYSVFSAPAPPAVSYSSSVNPTSANIYVPTNMASGNYTVLASDGACQYNATFTVSDYVYDYTVSPVTSTLCFGNGILASVSFSSPPAPGQYSYKWSPSTYLTGGVASTTNISVTIAPVAPTNSILTTIYSVTVLPSAANCPITKTISVTAIDLSPPVFVIPNFCNNSSSKTITAVPTGGTFSTTTGNWLGSTGIITPSLASIGTNTFAYSISLGTCAASSNGSFSVSQFNSAALTNSLLNLCNSNICTDLMTVVQSTTSGIWSGPAVYTNSFCPGNLALGSYTLTYQTSSTPIATVCPDIQSLLIISGQSPSPVIVPQGSICTNTSPFTMTVSPTGGSWSSTLPSLITSNGLVDPANAPIGNTFLSYSVAAGACVGTSTTMINVSQFHSAALSSSLLDLCISSSSFSLMSLVLDSSGTWSGPNVINSMFTPPSAAGTSTLYYNTYSMPNASLCPDFRQLTILYGHPLTPTIVPIATQCNINSPLQLTVTPSSGYFSVRPYLTAGGLLTPSLCAVGNNTVLYTVGTSTCNAKDQILVAVEAFVPSTITGSVSGQCSTNGPINLMTLVQYTTGTWTIWNGPTLISAVFNPATSGIGNFTLFYKTSSIPSGLCPETSSMFISVSRCTGLEELTFSQSLHIYPNPASKEVFIESDALIKVMLYDELGKILLEAPVAGGSYVLDLSLFNSGVYFIKAISSTSQVFSKVIKMN